jgi:hypothetical protein
MRRKREERAINVSHVERRVSRIGTLGGSPLEMARLVSTTERTPRPINAQDA